MQNNRHYKNFLIVANIKCVRYAGVVDVHMRAQKLQTKIEQ